MLLKPQSLHAHTTRSDGTLSPVMLLKKAALHGLAAVAITDHDSLPDKQTITELKSHSHPNYPLDYRY